MSIGVRLHVVVDGRFVGRQIELDRFADLLRGILADHRPLARARRRAPPDGPAIFARSPVVLVHGSAGVGKSRLLGQFRDIAEGTTSGSSIPPGRLSTVWLDWERALSGQPFPDVTNKIVDLLTVLNSLQNAVTDAASSRPKTTERAQEAFAAYRDGALRIPELATRSATVVTRGSQAGSPFSSTDVATLLKTAATLGLSLGGHPVGLMGLTADQLSSSAQAAGHLSEAATRAITGRKSGTISSQEYDLVTDPVRELTRRVAFALNTIATEQPLVFLLDSGELIDATAWSWIRRILTQTTDGVIWVVGGRFGTEADAGSASSIAMFQREIDAKHLLLMSPRPFDQELTATYIETNTGRPLDQSQVDRVTRFTRGLPLAVSMVATDLRAGRPLDDICCELRDGYPTGLISHLAQAYLPREEHYAEKDHRQTDLMRILGLALAFGDLREDPTLLSTLWDVKNPIIVCQELGRRYDYVLPVSRRLHEHVRDLLRVYLLDPYQRAQIRELNERAEDLFHRRLADMRARWPLLDDQLNQSMFRTALLSTLWHTFWVDNQRGLDVFVAILPVLAVADPSAASTATAMIEQFAPTLARSQLDELNLLTQVTPTSTRHEFDQFGPAAGIRRLKYTLAGLELTAPASAASTSLLGTHQDREVAVLILTANLRATERADEEAVTNLRYAAEQSSSTRFNRVIRMLAASIADRQMWTSSSTDLGPAAGLAAVGLCGRLPHALKSYDEIGVGGASQ